MRKKLGYLLILLVSAIVLPGCIYLRPMGPCYGVGCPALTSSQSAPQSQAAANSARGPIAENQTSQDQAGKSQSTQAPTNEAQKPAPKKGFFSHLIPKWGHANSGK